MVSAADACHDENLFLPTLGDPESWSAWHAVLRAAFGENLNRRERRLFSKIAGSRRPPRKAVQELWAIVGRRSGKSRMAAVIAAYLAGLVDHSAKLSPGEPGYVLTLAVDKAQAALVFGYIIAIFEGAPMLRALIAKVTTTELHLTNGVIVSVHAASFRSIRGRTILACVFDEASFWKDETSVAPDLEVYRAVLPSLATTGGMLIGISSPYRRLGLLFQKFDKHFGRNDDDVLVVRGPTLLFNPTIDAGIVKRAREADPVAAASEWDAEFRSDLQTLLDDAWIDDAIDRGRPAELPAQQGVRYRAFIDPSGGRVDEMTLAIVHDEDGIGVLDCLRAVKPPFHPGDTCRLFATTMKSYGLSRCHGDRYAAQWVKTSFTDAGIHYEHSQLDRSALYLEALGLFAQGRVRIPGEPKLIAQLRGLERRVGRQGKDAVDHRLGQNDDRANALAGALVMLTKPVAEPRIRRL